MRIADRHPLVRADAQLQQVPGQLVGLLVELAITQALLPGLHRQGLGAAQHLGLEQPVQGLLQRVVAGGGVEAFQQLPALGLGQDRHLQQGTLRHLLQAVHQGQQGLLQVAAHPCGANPRRGHGGQAKALAKVVDVEAQRVVGALFAVQGLDALPGLAHGLARRCIAAVAVVEHGAEQRQRRGHPTATLGQGQGRMLVAKQLRQPRVGVAQGLLYPLPAQADPQRQGVDEHAQGPVRPRTALHAPQQHGAEHHILTTRQGAQYTGPGQVGVVSENGK